MKEGIGRQGKQVRVRLRRVKGTAKKGYGAYVWEYEVRGDSRDKVRKEWDETRWIWYMCGQVINHSYGTRGRRERENRVKQRSDGEWDYGGLSHQDKE